jgi:hypothetical protein
MKETIIKELLFWLWWEKTDEDFIESLLDDLNLKKLRIK